VLLNILVETMIHFFSPFSEARVVDRQSPSATKCSHVNSSSWTKTKSFCCVHAVTIPKLRDGSTVRLYKSKLFKLFMFIIIVMLCALSHEVI